MRVLAEGSADRTVLLFGSDTDPGPELTWARGITLLSVSATGAPADIASPVGVVGYGAAGIDALTFAAQHAGGVDRLVLVSTPIPEDETSLPFALSHITAKTLLLFGAKDPHTGSRHGAWWQKHLPDARLEMAPQGGHELLEPMWKRVLS